MKRYSLILIAGLSGIFLYFIARNTGVFEHKQQITSEVIKQEQRSQKLPDNVVDRAIESNIKEKLIVANDVANRALKFTFVYNDGIFRDYGIVYDERQSWNIIYKNIISQIHYKYKNGDIGWRDIAKIAGVDESKAIIYVVQHYEIWRSIYDKRE